MHLPSRTDEPDEPVHCVADESLRRVPSALETRRPCRSAIILVRWSGTIGRSSALSSGSARAAAYCVCTASVRASRTRGTARFCSRQSVGLQPNQGVSDRRHRRVALRLYSDEFERIRGRAPPARRAGGDCAVSGLGERAAGAGDPGEAEGDRAAQRAEAGHHPPRRHPRPRPLRPPQTLRHPLARRHSAALGGAAAASTFAADSKSDRTFGVPRLR